MSAGDVLLLIEERRRENVLEFWLDYKKVDYDKVLSNYRYINGAQRVA